MKNGKWLIALLALACAVGIAAHLRMPRSTQLWRMASSAAHERRNERMEANLPQGTVDVNHGSLQELDELYSVGSTLAQAIVDERETNGQFSYPEDLINVKGIGEKTLEKMREQIYLP